MLKVTPHTHTHIPPHSTLLGLGQTSDLFSHTKTHDKRNRNRIKRWAHHTLGFVPGFVMFLLLIFKCRQYSKEGYNSTNKDIVRYKHLTNQSHDMILI